MAHKTDVTNNRPIIRKAWYVSVVNCRICFDKDGSRIRFVKDADEDTVGVSYCYCPRCGYVHK